jgi:hypothetical protein
LIVHRRQIDAQAVDEGPRQPDLAPPGHLFAFLASEELEPTSLRPHVLAPGRFLAVFEVSKNAETRLISGFREIESTETDWTHEAIVILPR